MSAWAAANDAPVLELEGGVSGARLARFLRGAGVDLAGVAETFRSAEQMRHAVA